MAYRFSADLRVKERDDVDRCRHCARPTWSLRRCCVRCKRDGLAGPGTVASLHARGARPRIGVAFACYWLGHVAFSVIAGHMILWALGMPRMNGNFPAILMFVFLEGALEGIGFLIAVMLSPRPVAELRFRYYLLAAGIGAVCAIVTNAALFNPARFGVAALLGWAALLVLFSAVATRVLLGFALATRLVHSGESLRCKNCGHDLSFEAEPICPDCD